MQGLGLGCLESSAETVLPADAATTLADPTCVASNYKMQCAREEILSPNKLPAGGCSVESLMLRCRRLSEASAAQQGRQNGTIEDVCHEKT